MSVPCRTASLAVLGALTIASPIAGAADEIPTLRWEDVEAALDRHPGARVADREAEVAAGEVAAARQLPNPTVEIGAGRAEALEEEGEADVWEVSVLQPLPWPGPRGGAIAAAEAEREAARAEAAVARRQIQLEMAENFWHLVHDQERLGMLEESLGRLDELVDVARRRVELGEARPMERDRLEIERARMGSRVDEVRAEAGVHRQLLRLWLAPDAPPRFRAEGDLDALPPLPPLDGALGTARSRHPGIAATEHRARAAASRLRAERAARFPELAVGVYREEELDARTWGGAIEVSLPLWSLNRGGIARARAATDAAELRRDLWATELEASVRETHAEATIAYEKVRSLRDVILPKARETTTALEKMYQVGEIDVMDVLDARRSRIEIESELLGALLDSRLAALRLHALTGEIDHD
jgi:cobalt-zinc-cadmium efflux system outer membrane protein